METKQITKDLLSQKSNKKSILYISCIFSNDEVFYYKQS